MANFDIITVFDHNDSRLTKFRQQIFHDDLQLDTQLMSLTQSHDWWIKNHQEDAYKYSNHKWSEVGFDAIEVALENDQIVSMSGAKVYDDIHGHRFLRVNMFYYILKAFRGKYNGIVYQDCGFFDRHIIFAKSIRCRGLFFTIYPHSSKLKAMVINHTKRRISHVRSKLKYWDDIQHLGEYQLNNVLQEFFYYPLANQKLDPISLIN
jgi:hypothetical protein